MIRKPCLTLLMVAALAACAPASKKATPMPQVTPTVPKAPPLAAEPRQRDYLDGFLKERPPMIEALEGETLKDQVITALRDIFDPEIPVNIYDLGLIYGVDVDEGHVTITAPQWQAASARRVVHWVNAGSESAV